MGRVLYDLIPEEGKHLANSHNTEGAVRGCYLDDENNKPCGSGEFMPVEIEDDEDEEYNSSDVDWGNDGISFEALGLLAIGAAIGIGAYKAYPLVKKWFTSTAVPGVKKFWRKVAKKEPEQAIECAEIETALVLMKPEKFSESIDLAVNEYHANTNSPEAQQHLLNIMCAAMYIASEIRQLTNSVLKAEDRMAWGAAFEKLTTRSVTDGINHILEGSVLALDGRQAKTLAEYFGNTLIVNGAFVPLESGRIKEVLQVYPQKQ